MLNHSTFSYTGDLVTTLNVLTNVSNPDTSKTLANLSTENYLSGTDEARNTEPNASNQLIFMNQPMSWWLENLQSSGVYYLPYSNYVNWGYKDASGNVYHIHINVTNLLIPNYTDSTSRDSSGNIHIDFKAKFGLSRTDMISM
jgi:hypothetical protein